MVRFKDLAWNCANIKKMFKEKDEGGVLVVYMLKYYLNLKHIKVTVG